MANDRNRSALYLTRRETLLAGAAAATGLLLPRTALAAGYHYTCDWRAGFVMDPAKKQRVGYLTTLKVFGAADTLEPDIEVFSPFNATPKYEDLHLDGGSHKAKVAAVLEDFSWGGGVGDPLVVSGYVSADNAHKLKAKLHSVPSNALVQQLGYWVGNFDEEAKAWFEEAHPHQPTLVKGQVNAPGGKDLRIHVADEPTKVGRNIDLDVYNLHIEVIPAMNSTFALHFATSSRTPFVRNWGLKVSSRAAQFG